MEINGISLSEAKPVRSQRRRFLSPLDAPIKTSESKALGLVASFGMVTIDQLATALGCHREDASKKLRVLGHYRLVGFCKAVRKQAAGPSRPCNPFHIYALTKRGAVRAMHDHVIHGSQPMMVRDWKGHHVTRTNLGHDLKTVDCLIAFWRAQQVVQDQYLLVSMTPDFVLDPIASKEQSSLKDMVGRDEFIIPDALCVLENRSTHRSMNLFVELDNGSVDIVQRNVRRASVVGKLVNWNAYLKKPRTRHSDTGDVDLLLYVAEKESRLDVIRTEMRRIFKPTDDVARKIRFATLDQIRNAFLGPVWSRLDGTAWSPIGAVSC